MADDEADLIWCDECGEYHDSECPEHGPAQPLVASPVLTRARRSLPPSLEIRGLPDGGEGVFTRVPLTKRTQFGPLLAPRVPALDREPEMPLKVFSRDGTWLWLQTSSEMDTNWLVLVRFATLRSHQNLTVFQLHDDLYFTTSKDIAIGEELRVCYAGFYARRMNRLTLRETETGRASSTTQSLPSPGLTTSTENKVQKWKCRVCPVVFDDPQHLTDHIVSHVGDVNTDSQPDAPRPETNETVGRSSRQRKPRSFPEDTETEEVEVEIDAVASAENADNTDLDYTPGAPSRSSQTSQSSRGRRAGALRRLARKSCHPQRVFVCERCHRSFSNGSNYNRHLRSHGAKMFRCEECGKDFTRRESLKQHVSYKHSRAQVDEEFPLQCSACLKAFRCQNTLQQHNCQTDGRTFQCNICLKLFSTGSNLSKHCKKHGERHFGCDACGKKFYRKDVLLEHLRRHMQRAKRWVKEDGEVEGTPRGKYRKEPSPCPVCGKIFSCRSNMNKHLLTHGDKKYGCEICGRRFYRVDVLRDHTHVHFKDIAVMEESERSEFISRLGIEAEEFAEGQERVELEAGEEVLGGQTEDSNAEGVGGLGEATAEGLKYVCKKCQIWFARGSDYVEHLSSEHGESAHTCNICRRSFALKATYHAHMVIHRHELPTNDPSAHKYIHPCEVCGKIFNSSGNLERHRVIHTGVKSHACAQCGKSFARRDMLKEHMRVHDTSRDYLCAECGKGMKTKHALRHHMKLHKGIREFACAVCGRRFSQKVNMLKHLRRHSGTKDYICELCGKTFCERTSLETHKLMHIEGKRYECNVCQRKFVTAYMLGKHTQLTHERVEAQSCDVCGTKVSTRASLNRHLRRKHPELQSVVFISQDSVTLQEHTITVVTPDICDAKTEMEVGGGREAVELVGTAFGTTTHLAESDDPQIMASVAGTDLAPSCPVHFPMQSMSSRRDSSLQLIGMGQSCLQTMGADPSSTSSHLGLGQGIGLQPMMVSQGQVLQQMAVSQGQGLPPMASQDPEMHATVTSHGQTMAAIVSQAQGLQAITANHRPISVAHGTTMQSIVGSQGTGAILPLDAAIFAALDVGRPIEIQIQTAPPNISFAANGAAVAMPSPWRQSSHSPDCCSPVPSQPSSAP